MAAFFILGALTLPPAVKNKIDSQGFAIVQTGERNIYDLYEQCKKHNEPVLVTVDLLLHTSHLLFGYTLRAIELNVLLPKLDTLTLGMLEAVKEKKVDGGDDLLAFFGVASKLLDIETRHSQKVTSDKRQETDEVRKKVLAELDLIGEHNSFSPSPIFGYYEDYTQYVPRGHYTRNYDFTCYFKAMMWYGRLGFYLNPNQTMYPEIIDTKKEGIRLTRMAISIAKVIQSSPELKRLWTEIYDPTVYFAGKSDDYTIQQYSELIKKYKGVQVSIPTDSAILFFIDKALELPSPLIVSAISEDTVGLQSFKFFGQRFIPDGWIFQNLVYPEVSRYTGTGEPFTLERTVLGPLRCFPRGLDIMSVLGSQYAGDILKQEGDTEYEDYYKQINELKSFFNNLSSDAWQETLYWRWLYTLKELITYKHSSGAPDFMHSKAWALKELNTALASWSQLRHDAILYAKQSYTLLALSIPAPPKFTKGWVEPYPEIYILMGEVANELAKIPGCPEEIKKKLTEYIKVLASLTEISKKELKEKDLVEEEYNLIWNIGSKLKSLSIFSDKLMKQITSGTDEKMAVIADVHTDPNSQQVLEEGVGYTNTIYVKVDRKIYKGGIFSYYEFKAPMSERYTDEKWQEELERTPRELQKWFLPLLK